MKKMLSSFALALLAAIALVPSGRAQAQAQSGSVQSNGATIAYRVQGHGPALMLIHGYPLSGELFARNRALLAQRYTVVTPTCAASAPAQHPIPKAPSPSMPKICWP